MIIFQFFFILTIFLSVEPALVGIRSLESGLPFFKHRQFNPSYHMCCFSSERNSFMLIISSIARIDCSTTALNSEKV